MMAALARQSGDPEALVEIKRRDLSHAYSYFQIAEIYREVGQHDKALDWAEEGLKASRNAIRDWLSFSLSNITAANVTMTR